MNKYLLIIVVANLALLAQANAELYQYIDENGNVVVTDNAGNIPENQRSKEKTLKEQSAYSANPAPYTVEAAKKIEDASAKCGLFKMKENATPEEKQKIIIERIRLVYKVAGYSFDDTIVQVAKDIPNAPELIKVTPAKKPILEQVTIVVQLIMLKCKDEKVDCLKFFSTDTAAAIRAIMVITGKGNNGMWGETQNSDKIPTNEPSNIQKAEKSNIQKNRPRKMSISPPPPESSQEKQ